MTDAALEQVGQQTGAAASLIAASALLEQAVHAQTFGDALTSLQSAAEWASFAQQDLANAGFADAAMLAGQLVLDLEAMADLSVPPDCLTLNQWQQQDLVPLQGAVAAILALPAAEELAAIEQEQETLYNQGMVAFLGVAGLAATILGTAAFIDYRQRHGGWPAPHARVTPVVNYRY